MVIISFDVMECNEYHKCLFKLDHVYYTTFGFFLEERQRTVYIAMY